MAGFDNGVVYADNVDFRGVTPVVGQVTADGQLLIGSTAAPHLKVATLTAGTGISITNGSGTIQISTASSGVTWNDVTGTSASMAANNGYLANNSGLVTLTLPAVVAQFSIIQIAGFGAGGWLISLNSGQNIQLGSSSTTVGVGGSLASTNRYDNITIMCVVANTTFICFPPQGNVTVT